MELSGGALAEDGPAATSPDTVPIPRDSVVPLPRSDSGPVLLIDVHRRSVHTVNLTGGMIWAHCDGERSVGEIISALAERFVTDVATIAGDVVRSITEFRDFGLLRTTDDPPFFDQPTVELQPGPDGSSFVVPTPCRCGVDLDELEWAGSVTVALGSRRMGIRYDSDATGALVRHELREWIVDADAPIAFTVVFPDVEPSEGRPTRPGLYEGRRFQSGPSDDVGIIDLLRCRVAAWRPVEPSEVRLRAIGIVGPNGIALVPAHHGVDAQLRELARGSDGRFVASPVMVDAERVSVNGSPLAGIVWPDTETRRLDPDDALRKLVSLLDVRPAEDPEHAVDALDALSRSANAVATPSAQIADVAHALVRPR